MDDRKIEGPFNPRLERLNTPDLGYTVGKLFFAKVVDMADYITKLEVENVALKAQVEIAREILERLIDKHRSNTLFDNAGHWPDAREALAAMKEKAIVRAAASIGAEK